MLLLNYLSVMEHVSLKHMWYLKNGQDDQLAQAFILTSGKCESSIMGVLRFFMLKKIQSWIHFRHYKSKEEKNR
ncbi:hypothetical protein HFA01_37700 [Halobacillus faecis]|uniref:Uncharacterized protein n=1 Tax=Halobacillus faecis TaxID=360184 RepID=A0A511WYH6_9BACI|nr:hypothetical protein HFA01_37700 [Halobacillus faecis]